MENSIANEILQKSAKINGKLVDLRHRLHSIAEVGFRMNETVALVKDVLGDFDCKIRKCGRAGLVTALGNGMGRTLLLRADMDALPIKEETGLKYAATNGNMHACGHDIHTAMLLGAFELLYEYRDKIQGRVLFAFQPAEETLEGASDMISDGLLDGGVDMAMMIHVLSQTNFRAGYTIVSSPGVSAPSSDFFKITVHGKSAHGGMPSNGKDALACAARITLLIEDLQALGFSWLDRATLSVGMLEGGTAPNVIADKSVLCGTVRAYSKDTRARLLERIGDAADRVADIFGCRTELEITTSCPALKNDEACSEKIFRYAKELFGEDFCTLSDNLGGKGGGGSEDFAYISDIVPSVTVAMSAGSAAEGYDKPLHNPQTMLSDDVIRHGAALLAYSALSYFAEKD